MRIIYLSLYAVICGCSVGPAETAPADQDNPTVVADRSTDAGPTKINSETTEESRAESLSPSGEAFAALIDSPNRESYIKVYESLVRSEAYNPYSNEVDEAYELFEDGKATEARAKLQDAMGNLILSPRAHDFLGFLYHQLGDEQKAEMELRVSFACILGILATGDGSSEKPYLVARTSDEYDVLRHLKKQFRQQSLIEREGKHFDKIECADGSEYWFDITDSYGRLGAMLSD
ncbi:MAG: DUF4919 domain-containing protein [Planctomycetota bacterium]